AGRETFTKAPEVGAGPGGGWGAVSRANAGVGALWGEAKSLAWKSDGLDVQGWLIGPREVAAGRRYPLVVQVHGGPASSWMPVWAGGRYGPPALRRAVWR